MLPPCRTEGRRGIGSEHVLSTSQVNTLGPTYSPETVVKFETLFQQGNFTEPPKATQL